MVQSDAGHQRPQMAIDSRYNTIHYPAVSCTIHVWQRQKWNFDQKETLQMSYEVSELSTFTAGVLSIFAQHDIDVFRFTSVMTVNTTIQLAIFFYSCVNVWIISCEIWKNGSRVADGIFKGR